MLFAQSELPKMVSEAMNFDNGTKLDSIARKLNYKAGDQIKILTSFTVDEEGNVVDIKARSVHPFFEQEAIRVISELPKMPVAKHNGEAISQKYALPIIFEITSAKAKNRKVKKGKKDRG